MRTSASRTIRRLLLGVLGMLGVASTADAMRHVIDGQVGPRGRRTHALHVGLEDYWLTVRGNGRTDLDCWVYDSYGELVDSDTDETDYCILETPGVGTHRLVIRNFGGRTNYYTIRQLASLD